MDTNPKAVGAMLRAKRKYAQLTQHEIAVRIGIPQAHVCEMEHGRRLSFVNVNNFLAACGCVLTVRSYDLS